MGSVKEKILGVILLVAIPILVFMLYRFGVIQNVTSLIEQVVAMLVVAMIGTGITLIYHGSKKEKASQGEVITIYPSSPKRVDWFSKLRRPPIRKENRVDFWKTVITMLMCGTVLIIIALNFSSASIPLETIFTFLVMRYMIISGGILMITLSTWFIIAELYVMWESRKQLITDRAITYSKLIIDFDRSFQNLKQATQQKTKEMLLDDFQNRLRNLCYDYHWSEEKRVRITEVLSYIPDRISSDPNIDSYLLFLGFIIHHDSDHTIRMVKEKFLVELEDLYNDPRFETNPKPMNLLQELHEHSEEYMMKLLDDASSTTKWSDRRFQALANNIELWELKTKDKEVHTRVSHYILRKMDDAARNKDDEAFKRLDALFAIVKR